MNCDFKLQNVAYGITMISDSQLCMAQKQSCDYKMCTNREILRTQIGIYIGTLSFIYVGFIWFVI